jgi:hypothetical protein
MKFNPVTLSLREPPRLACARLPSYLAGEFPNSDILLRVGLSARIFQNEESRADAI